MGTLGRAVWAHRRSVISVLAGLLTALLLPASVPAGLRGIVAWDAGVTAFLMMAAWLFATEATQRMPANARAQQEGEWTIFGLTLGVVFVSFFAVTSEFAALKGMPAPWPALRVALVGVTLLESWLVTHVTFAFRYAHEYYARDQGGPDIDRGLDFPGEKHPDYLDFLYFALVVGMTFQVSDVQITSRKLRRLATLQGLISFLFNTVIVAVTVNVAAGLL